MKTHHELFEIIKSGRRQIEKLPVYEISDSTREGYVREYNRLVDPDGSAPEGLWSAICTTNSKSTYRRRLAAVAYCCRLQLSEALRKQDQAQRAGDIQSLHLFASQIEWALEVLKIINNFKGTCPLPAATRRKSKRSDLRKLPNDWRELLYKKLEHSKYRLPYLVEAISGCRPGELEIGVKVTCTKTTLIVRIDNGIKVTKNKGQPWREITYSIDKNSHNLVKALHNACMELGSEACTLIQIDKASNWRAALSAFGRSLWPKLTFRICPYHLRNAAASDFKRSEVSDEEVSAALGHCVDKTVSLYGQHQVGRGSSGLRPETITAARQILKTRSLLPTVPGLVPPR